MGYSCGDCPQGYFGDGRACTVLPPCSAQPCFVGTTCTDDQDGGFLCGDCPPGTSGDGVACVDDDGCAGGDDCFEGVPCIDNAAPAIGYRCGECPVGFAGDGHTCSPIPPCDPNPCAQGGKCLALGPGEFACCPNDETCVGFREVSIGGNRRCFLHESGPGICLGERIESPAGNFKKLSVGDEHVCGLRPNGEIECFGAPADSPVVNGVQNEVYLDVATGDGFACGLLAANHSPVCWGEAGESAITETPTTPFKSIVAGLRQVCGIGAESDLVTCWGGSGSGQPPDQPVDSIVAGSGVSCAILGDGQAVCWGGTTTAGGPGPQGTFASLGSGANTMGVCGVRLDGSVVWWRAGETEVVPALAGADIQSIACGSQSDLCGISSVGKVVCVGSSFEGQARPPPGQFKLVSASHRNTCALTVDNEQVCWGLGPSVYSNPVQVGPVLQIEHEDFYGCRINDEGGIQC